MRQMISLNELAALWRCHRTTVRRRLSAARIDPVMFGGSRSSMVRYYVEDVERYLRQCSGRLTRAASAG